MIPTGDAVIPIEGPKYDFEFESMVISFQKLSVDAVNEDDYPKNKFHY